MTWLTRDGRRHRRWAAAAAEPDPVTALAGLFEVLDDIDRRPGGCGAWWPDLVTSMTQDGRLDLLEAADLRRLETVGERVAAEAGAELSLAEAWLPIADAYTARGEPRQATRLLLAVHRRTPQRDVQTDVTARLARNGTTGDAELAVYLDCLTGAAPDRVRAAVRGAIAAAVHVDLDTPVGTVRRARDIVEQLQRAEITQPGARRVLGFAALLADGDPRAAVAHLEAARTAEPTDPAVFAGLLAARLRSGDHRRIAELGDLPHPSTGQIGALLHLSRTLAWLDDPSIAGPAPRPAGDPVVAGEWLPYATARLQLLDGDPAPALPALARTAAGDPSWRYHAAWAAALSGDRDGVALQYTAAEDSPDRWTIACVLLDADPETAGRIGIGAAALQASPWGAAVFTARLQAGTLGPRDPRVVVPPDDPAAPMTERLERLRLDLGCRHARGAALTDLVASGLFDRLPKAERLLWTGLRGRAGDLDEAARLGHPRAPLVLAVHHLERHDLDTATAALTRVAWRTDATVTLLRTWIDARTTGATDLPAGDARTHYLLGNLRLAKDPAEAARHFTAALTAAPTAGTAPADTATLAACATLAAGGVPAGGVPAVERPIPGRIDWVRWMVTVGRLADAPETATLDACTGLVDALERAGTRTGPVADTITELLIRACVRDRSPRRTKGLRRLVYRLAPHTVDRLDELLLAASWRDRLAGRGAAARKDVAGLTARTAAPALVAAEVWLRVGEPSTALRVLREVPRDAPGHALVAALIGTLDGTADPDTLTDLPILRAAALARSAPERCVELLATTGADLTRVLDLRPSLGWWCARIVRARTIPEPLRDAIRALAARPSLDIDQVLLARCATAARDLDTAHAVWSRHMTGRRRPDELRAEYARFLSHRAAADRKAGGDAAGAVGLAALWDPDGAALAGLAQRTVLADLAGRLVGVLFPRIPVQRRDLGRYRVLAAVVEQNSALVRALTDDDRDAAVTAWRERLPAHADNVELRHALAVLHREDALAAAHREDAAGPDAASLTAATVQWAALLSTAGFWRRHPRFQPEHVTALTRDVMTELLALHMAAGNQDLAAGRPAAAREHLAAVTGLAKGTGPIAELAKDRLAEWCAQLIGDAERTLLDPDAIGRLPDGVDRNYAGAIGDLAGLTATAAAPEALLVAALNWYNDWGHRLYLRQEPDELRTILAPAQKLADRLAARSTPGVGHLPANRALCRHFVLRGWLGDEDDAGEAHLRTALRWNPSDGNAANLLRQAVDQARARRLHRHFDDAQQAQEDGRLDEALTLLRLALAETAEHSERAAIQRTIDTVEVRAAAQQLKTALEAGGDWEPLLRRLIADGATATDRQRRTDTFATTLNNHGVAVLEQAQTATKPYRKAFDDLQQGGRRSGMAGWVVDSRGTATHHSYGCGVCGPDQSATLAAIREKPAAQTFRGVDVLKFWQLLRPQLCQQCRTAMDGIRTSRTRACDLLTKAVELAPGNDDVRANLDAALTAAGRPVVKRKR